MLANFKKYKNKKTENYFFCFFKKKKNTYKNDFFECEKIENELLKLPSEKIILYKKNYFLLLDLRKEISEINITFFPKIEKNKIFDLEKRLEVLHKNLSSNLNNQIALSKELNIIYESLKKIKEKRA